MILLIFLLFYATAFYVVISAIIYAFLSLFTSDRKAKFGIALSWPLWLLLGVLGMFVDKK